MLNAQPTVQSETTQDYANSLETAQQHNQSLATAPYSKPYFVSKEELPQTNCNTLQTVQGSRLGSNEKRDHIQPAWIVQSPNSKIHQVDMEIDTGAGCNIMQLYKLNELFGEE